MNIGVDVSPQLALQALLAKALSASSPVLALPELLDDEPDEADEK